MATGSQPLMVAFVATLISVVGFLAFSIYAPTVYVSPVITVSAQYAPTQLQNPGGPTIFITIQTSTQSQPIKQISATLKFYNGIFALEGLPATSYRTLMFPSVTETSPILPGDWISQKYGWVGPSELDSYVTISGTLANGEKFSSETNIIWIP